jgi:hypothetical protein
MTNSIRSHDGTTERQAVGERCGFYAAMSEAPLTAVELAKRTAAPIRFVQKWLANQVRDGYLVHEAASDRYANWCSLPRAA